MVSIGKDSESLSRERYLERKDNLTKRIKRFNTILTEAENIHVGKTKLRRNAKTIPAVRTALRKRNRLMN